MRSVARLLANVAFSVAPLLAGCGDEVKGSENDASRDGAGDIETPLSDARVDVELDVSSEVGTSPSDTRVEVAVDADIAADVSVDSAVDVQEMAADVGAGDAHEPETPMVDRSGIFEFTGGSPTFPLEDELSRGLYTKFAAAAGQELTAHAEFPEDLSPFRCVVLPCNEAAFSEEQVASLAGYLAGGGTLIAASEQDAFAGSRPGMNALFSALGSLGAVGSGQFDRDGFDVTMNVNVANRLANGVVSLGFGNTAEVVLGDGVQALASTPDGHPFIGSDEIGLGILVITGDINWISDHDNGAFASEGNAVLALNLCGVID